MDDVAALYFAQVVYYGKYGLAPNQLHGMAIAAVIDTKEANVQLAAWLENLVLRDNTLVVQWSPWQSLFLALIVYGWVHVAKLGDYSERLADIRGRIDNIMRC